MHQSLRVLSIVIGTAASAALLSSTSALAYSVSAPITRGNLSVYPIHGSGDAQPSLTTLDRGLASGEARVTHDEDGFKVQNLSNAPMLVPFGMLLKGGPQDQVVGASLIVPAHSEPVGLSTFCVDPFRSEARSGESEDVLVGAKTLIPSLSAKLAILSGTETSVPIQNIRRLGVWWSLDTIKTRLANRLGHQLLPPKPVTWPVQESSYARIQLHDRTGAWSNSLPLDLEDESLVEQQRSISASFEELANSSPDVVGAAFVVNGHWVGTQIDASHALFSMTWPALLRDYAVESLVEDGKPQVSPPSAAEIAGQLDRSPANPENARSVGNMTIYDLGSSIMARTLDETRAVQTTLLPKLDPARAAENPSEFIVSMLDANMINGQPLTSLQDTPHLAKYTALDPTTGERRELWQAIMPVREAQTPDTGLLGRVIHGLSILIFAYWFKRILVKDRGGLPSRLYRKVRTRAAVLLLVPSRLLRSGMGRLISEARILCNAISALGYASSLRYRFARVSSADPHHN